MRKFLPFLTGLSLFFGLEASFRWPGFFYVFSLLEIAILYFAIQQIFKIKKKKVIWKHGFVYSFLLSIIFFFGILTSSLFIRHNVLFYVINFVASFFLYDFLSATKNYVSELNNLVLKKDGPRDFSFKKNFESKSILFNLLALFFSLSAIYGLIIFFQIPLWYLTPLVFLLGIFLFRHAFFTKGEDVYFYDKKILIASLIFVQFFVVLNYLPATFLVGGLFITIFYGISLVMAFNFLRDPDNKRAKFYQIAVIFLLLLILLFVLKI